MRVTLDFDGVLTEAWTPTELQDLDQHALLLSTVPIAAARRRPGVRAVAGFLGAFASIDVVTARPANQAPAIAAWIREQLPELGDTTVHSCPTEQKAAFVNSERIALHIDDDPRANDGSHGRCVIWHNQPIKQLLRDLADILTRHPGLQLGGRAVTGIVELPSHSATPVFRVDTEAGPFKLRVVEDRRQSTALTHIHQVAATHPALAYMLDSELAGLPSHVHVTQYVPGKTVASEVPSDSAALIEQVAQWMAALHQETLRDDGTCLVSCACDAFNLCIAPGGTPRIIDAGDCLYAPRWVDLVWTEQLLCPWTGGADRLVKTYLAATNMRPTLDEAARAMAGYYYRLHDVLRQALRQQTDDPQSVAALLEIRAKRATSPADTLLRRYAV